MKKVLITGAKSYIGESFAAYISATHPDWTVDTVDMIDGSWRQYDFSGYDSVFHVAGIAHQKETKENAPMYYKVNRDLVTETARKAKNDGVSQFVFLSSMSVYGSETGEITRQTPTEPRTHYGSSKLQAEQLLKDLEDEHFAVAILRPPMVYGKGCKGNFQTVIKLVAKLPFFPKLNNRRSMIHINNLSACVAYLVQTGARGLYLPQNPQYMNTSEMAQSIAKAMGKKCRLSRFLGVCAQLIIPFVGTARKAFGSLTYAMEEQPWIVVTSNERSVIESV